MISSFLLMAVGLLVYNGIAFGLGGSSDWESTIFSLTMMSGSEWKMSTGDLMIAFGLLLLFFEILKATRIGRLSIVDHLLSTLVLIVFIVEFLLFSVAANSVFFILMLMTLVDVMAGFSVSIRSATRDVSLGEGGL